MRVGEEALDPATCCWVRRRAPKVKAFLAVVAGMASLVVLCFHTRERTRWASPSSSTPRRRPALVRSLPSSPAPFSEAFLSIRRARMIPLRSDPSSSRDYKGLPFFRSIPICGLRHGRQRPPDAAVRQQTGPTRCPAHRANCLTLVVE
jgi:hypothetical protein